MVDDRRRARRFKAHLKIHLEQDGQGEQPHTIEDISSGGVFIPTDNPLPHLSPIKIRLFLPDGGEEGFLISGEVVRVVKPAAAKEKKLIPGMGIRFTEIPPEAEAALKHFIGEVGRLVDGKGSAEAGRPSLAVSIIDRRQEPRIRTRLKLRFKDKAALQEEYVKNISQGGVFIRSQRRFQRGEDVMVVLQHPNSGQEFELSGTVISVVDEKRVRSEPGLTRGVGIRFQDMGQRTLHELQDFIEEIVQLSMVAEEEEPTEFLADSDESPRS